MKTLKSLFLPVLVLNACIVLAQPNMDSKVADSLWSVWIDQSQPDSNRLHAIDLYAWDGYLYSQPDSTFYYGQLQYEYAKSKGIKKYMGNALLTQGNSYYRQDDFHRALDYCHRGFKIFEEIGNRKLMALALSDIGSINEAQGDYLEAMSYFKRSLSIRKELGDKRGTAGTLINIGAVYEVQGDYPQALDYFQRSLKISEESGDKNGIATTLTYIGGIYKEQGDYPQVLKFFQRSLKIRKEMGDRKGTAGGLVNVGLIYSNQGDYPQALEYYQRGFEICEEIGDKEFMAKALNNIGVIYSYQGDHQQSLAYYRRSWKIEEEMGNKRGVAAAWVNMGMENNKKKDYRAALDWCEKSLILSKETGMVALQKAACECQYQAYKALGIDNKALGYYEQMIMLRDSLFNEENTKKLTRLEMQYEFDKKEATTQAQQEKKDAIATQELERQKLVRNGFMGGFAAVLLFASVVFIQRNRISKEKARSEELLLNILPAETAQELKEKGSADAKLIDQVTVLFTDFKGFTQMSEQVTPKELVHDLHDCFSAFDRICEKYGIEKIKTIGDAYMAAGGLPTPNTTHATDVIQAALEIRDIMEVGMQKKIAAGVPYFEIRIGVHTGPVVAGIVGVKKFQYDIWGDTVNTASRMESSGAVGKINISGATYELVKDQFKCEYRGEIEAKGKGKMGMYFLLVENDAYFPK